MLQYYKPNKSVKGSAASFSLNSKKGNVFISVIKQVSYNEERHIGGFKGGKQANIQLDQFEIGALIDCIDSGRNFKGIHKSDKFTTTISFSEYIKEDKHLGYGLSIYRQGDNPDDKDSWLIGFKFGEAVVLKKWLEFALTHIFTADYSVDKKKNDEYFKNKQDKPTTNEPVANEPAASEEADSGGGGELDDIDF